MEGRERTGRPKSLDLDIFYSLNFVYCIFIFVCVPVCLCVCVPVCLYLMCVFYGLCVSSRESVIFFYHAGPLDQTQVLGFGGQYLHMLSPLAGLLSLF